MMSLPLFFFAVIHSKPIIVQPSESAAIPDG